MLDVSLPAAALGGLISFLSPCVLPLVPPYLSFLAGTTFDRLAAGDDRARAPAGAPGGAPLRRGLHDGLRRSSARPPRCSAS